MFRRIAIVLMVPYFVFFCAQSNALGEQSETCANLYDEIERKQKNYGDQLKAGDVSGVGIAGFIFGGFFGMAGALATEHEAKMNEFDTLRKLATDIGCKVPPEFEPPMPPSYEEIEKGMSPE